MYFIFLLMLSALADESAKPAPLDSSPSAEAVEGEDTAPPAASGAIELLYAPKPTYPQTAQEAEASGTVLLLLDINVTGQVINATVIESDREDLAEAALINARAFRFSPPKNAAGEPIELQVQYRTVFELQAAAAVQLEGQVREAGPRTPLTTRPQ